MGHHHSVKLLYSAFVSALVSTSTDCKGVHMSDRDTNKLHLTLVKLLTCQALSLIYRA